MRFLSSGHCESVVTRPVLISCGPDHALARLKIHPCFAFDVLSRLFAAPRFIPMSFHVRLTRTVTGIDYARDRLWNSSFNMVAELALDGTS